MEYTEKQKIAVWNWLQVVGLLMEYHYRFGDYALEVSREYFSQAGRMLGGEIKRDMKITGSDANAVAAVLNEFLVQTANIKDAVKIGRDQVIIVNKGFCPVMEAVRILNAPWDKIDFNYSCPMIEGIARGVNPNVRMVGTERRHRNDKICRHILSIP